MRVNGGIGISPGCGSSLPLCMFPLLKGGRSMDMDAPSAYGEADKLATRYQFIMLNELLVDSTLPFGLPLLGFEVYKFHVSAGGDGWSRGRNNRSSTSRVLRCLSCFGGLFCFFYFKLAFYCTIGDISCISTMGLENMAGGVDSLRLYLS